MVAKMLGEKSKYGWAEWEPGEESKLEDEQGFYLDIQDHRGHLNLQKEKQQANNKPTTGRKFGEMVMLSVYVEQNTTKEWP